MLRVRYPAKGRAARLYSLVVAWLDPGLLVACPIPPMGRRT
jgi:hypothetical protein